MVEKSKMTRSVGNLDIIATARHRHVPGWCQRLNKDVSAGGKNRKPLCHQENFIQSSFLQHELNDYSFPYTIMSNNIMLLPSD